MTRKHEKVANHYTVGRLEEQILEGLVSEGKDLNALTVDDLAAVDEFHIRGRASTEELAAMTNIGPGQVVLDVGCGLGGTSRFLADTRGCDVVGLDITPEYCRVAEMLSEKTGMADKTRFQQGSALELPFDDASFDVVWTEHVQMNIADKARFYGELARVLRPDGELVFHDIFAGNIGDFRFPVPWAHDASISHLASAEDVAAILADLGFVATRWEDKTEVSKAFFSKAADTFASQPPPIGLHLVLGDDATTKLRNMTENVDRGLARVIMAVMRRPS